MSLITLTQGTTYRGRAIIFHYPILVTKSAVKSGLEDQGFTNVTVWMDSNELPNNWPSSEKQDTSGSGETGVWLEGTWSQPTGQFQSENSDFSLVDYWIQSQPQTYPPINTQPPIVTNNQPPNNQPPSTELPTNQNNPPINIFPNCASSLMSCTIDSDCCSGLVCLDGYCAPPAQEISVTTVSDISNNNQKKWNWAVFIGGLVFGTAVAGFGIKLYNKV